MYRSSVSLIYQSQTIGNGARCSVRRQKRVFRFAHCMGRGRRRRRGTRTTCKSNPIIPQPRRHLHTKIYLPRGLGTGLLNYCILRSQQSLILAPLEFCHRSWSLDGCRVFIGIKTARKGP